MANAKGDSAQSMIYLPLKQQLLLHHERER